MDEGWEQWHVDGEKNCTSGREKWFWRAIYCAKLKPDPESQPGSCSCRGLWRLSTRIMWYYNLATAIVIWKLTQPHIFEMGSSSFFAMSRLKFESTTRVSFLSMLSNERANRENVSIACGSSYCDYPSFDYPNEPGSYPLAYTCRYPRQNIQIWHCWWRQYGFTISLRW